jgi:hypothetical protein
MEPSEADDQPRDLTDDEKLRLLPPMTALNQSLLRMWQLGMVVAHTSDDQTWRDKIASGIRLPDHPPAADDLVPLSEGEKVRVAEAMIVRFNLFKAAHQRGMIVAGDDERRELLRQLDRVLGNG